MPMLSAFCLKPLVELLVCASRDLPMQAFRAEYRYAADDAAAPISAILIGPTPALDYSRHFRFLRLSPVTEPPRFRLSIRFA